MGYDDQSVPGLSFWRFLWPGLISSDQATRATRVMVGRRPVCWPDSGMIRSGQWRQEDAAGSLPVVVRRLFAICNARIA